MYVCWGNYDKYPVEEMSNIDMLSLIDDKLNEFPKMLNSAEVTTKMYLLIF